MRIGLDTTHNCWHGSYSSFEHWRNTIAEAAGYKLVEDDWGWKCADIDWEKYQNNLLGNWKETPSDPLLVLIAHSDCDGFIYPDQALPLANRLEDVLKNLTSDKGWIVDATNQFIAGLRNAHKRNQKVGFD